MHRAFIALALVFSPFAGKSAWAGGSWADSKQALRLSGPEWTSSGLLLPKAFSAETASPAPSDASNAPASGIFGDWTLLTKEYGFGVIGQTVAGALGFYIGSGIETAFVGDSEAHKGWLSFTGIRYDNFYGAFWGGATGGLLGSAMTTYFIGQTDEEDGSLFWTTVGAAVAGAGAMYIASEMGVNDSRDWKPFIPLLALPSVGGAVGFNVSRWFSDRKRAQVVGPEASSVHWQPPRVAFGAEGMSLQALNFTF